MNRSIMKTLFPVILVVLMAILDGCKEESVRSALPTSVYVTRITQNNGIEERWLNVTVQARIETDIAFRTGGQITERLVNTGDHVVKGQPMALLDADDYRLAVKAAKEQFMAADISAGQSGSDMQRFQRLSEDGSMPTADYERQKSRFEAEYSGMEQARSALELAKNRYGYTTLRAPYDGIVSSIRMEVGQVVAEGQPVMTMAKDDECEMVANLPEEIAISVDQYRADVVSWNDRTNPVPVKLRELSPTAQPQGRTYRARFMPVGPYRSGFGHWPLGSTLQLRMSRPAETGVILPLGTIVKSASEPGVWAIGADGKSLEFKKVTIIRYENNGVRVRGLADNMRIVTVGAQKLDASMTVTPIERDSASMDEWSQRGSE